MQDLKRRGFLNNRFAAVLLILALSVGSLFAKGERRLEGKVTEIGQNYVTIEMANHKLQKVNITSATKFYKSKKPADFNGLKTGNHVVFLAVPDSTTTASSSNVTASTSEATSSTYDPSAANTQKDSLSLGLGFTAVEASY
ncbi:MAG TPA: hypothetical protein VFR24_19970 [Candidatus Angelobacter sp.]|nr:hypothetical protein [Candidatus Angelobacter sp.]